jgi:glyoxylase-like metal-dependent hydrolase (beta-lactamase superfamily II)
VIVWVRHANVIHMGDTFFNGRYPLVDLASGGSSEGFITAADRVLALADANTKIIPGHGPLGDRVALQAFRTMMATVRDRIKQAIAAGRTLDQVKAAKPTADFDAVWGNGRITPTLFVEVLFQDLSRR